MCNTVSAKMHVKKTVGLSETTPFRKEPPQYAAARSLAARSSNLENQFSKKPFRDNRGWSRLLGDTSIIQRKKQLQKCLCHFKKPACVFTEYVRVKYQRCGFSKL